MAYYKSMLAEIRQDPLKSDPAVSADMDTGSIHHYYFTCHNIVTGRM